MSGSVPQLSPPFNTTVLGDDGLHSQMWEAHHQELVNTIAVLQQSLTALQGSIGVGVTDGSDAAAGQIGEYLTASGSVGLTSGATVGVVTLTLSAGDWDVSGNALFVCGTGTHSLFAAGIGGLDTVYQATYPTTAIGPAISTATRRYSLTVATNVQLQAQAIFTGTVTCQGSVRARRVR